MPGSCSSGPRPAGGSPAAPASVSPAKSATTWRGPAQQRGELHTAFGGCGTDEFFYGIHAYAMLLGLMGPGVRSVEYLGQTHQKLLKINGHDGTVGLLVVGQAAKLPFYLTAVSTAAVEQIQIDPADIYRALLETCLPYLCGRVESPPLPMDVLLEPELAALAAQRSWLSGGEVLLTDLRQDDPGYDGTRFAAEYRQTQKIGDRWVLPMFDDRRYPATVQTILDEFGLGGCVRIARLGGTATPKFDVETDRGRFVVRVRSEEFSREDIVRFDHEVLRRLAAQGMPVPCPQERPDGTTWLHLNGHAIEVLSWVEGEPFSWHDLDAVRNVGRFLARFHAVLTGDIPPGKEGFLREDHPDLLMPFVDAIQSRCRTPSERALVARIGDEIESVRSEYDGKLRGRIPLAVIHGDIHTGNIMFRGSRVAAVYDFDYLSVEARLRDRVRRLDVFRRDPGPAGRPRRHRVPGPALPPGPGAIANPAGGVSGCLPACARGMGGGSLDPPLPVVPDPAARKPEGARGSQGAVRARPVLRGHRLAGPRGRRLFRPALALAGMMTA